jgi:LPS-assembly protein
MAFTVARGAQGDCSKRARHAIGGLRGVAAFPDPRPEETRILAKAPALAGPCLHRPVARRGALHALLLGATLATSPAAAQTGADTPARDAAPAGQPVAAEQIAFEAEQIDYDQDTDIVTASGNVRVARGADRLVADLVRWHRASGRVTASGNVVLANAEGDRGYTDAVEVGDTLRDGVIDNLLLVTAAGGRLAADNGRREGAIYVLDHAVYSPCRVEDRAGCPKDPTWQIQATRVVYDSAKKRVRYTGARIRFLGLALVPLPGLRHSVGDDGASGLLVPDVGYDRRNGLEARMPYYLRIANNRDLTITPRLYSAVLPMLQVDYRALLSRGAYQLSGYATVSGRTSISDPTLVTSEDRLRAYVSASGKFQFDSDWSLAGSLRYVTDRTFLNRYDISREDRLRSTLDLVRRDSRSYLSIAGWEFQSLRAGDPSGQVPVALPAIDYRLRLDDPLLGGAIQLHANSLAIVRSSGQDTQRAFAGMTWTRSRLTRLGQELTFTAMVRGDVYHSAQNWLSPTVLYRGDPGWQSRAIGAIAADMRWPLVGPAFAGTQRIMPRVQIVLAPRVSNMNIPNEDARAIDLEDSNLFALNRFPGYDRFEDSSRITFGFDYRLDLPDFALDATIGQSYRIDRRNGVVPDGTGLSDRLSDLVGRVQLRYKDFIALTHRFRVDKDDLAVRRNEIDATLGSRRNYAELGYLRLNRNVAAGVEDLRDIEEVRIGGRIAFASNWSVFGSTNIDLTGVDDDPESQLSGFEPVRHRLGVAYEDDCLQVGFTWRRDYQSTGDARRGNSFQLRLVFKNLGL